MIFLRGLGLLAALGGASEWRALATAAMGARASAVVIATADVPGRQRDYTATVRFTTAEGGTFELRRLLTRPRGGRGPRLSGGDDVRVAYAAGAPDRAVLLHSHENWAGALWVIPLGAVLVALSFVWAPRRTLH